jgi:methylmalonyl-CoA mutase C-terminal domain/subunit
MRVLLAKPGLDGHDRGVKVIAMALRDAGVEVVYLGLRCSVADILTAAIDEDVDVIGISILSGAHLALTRKLLERRDAFGAGHVPIVVGGTIPPVDAQRLVELGAAAVFPVGGNLDDVVAGVRALRRTTEREPAS